MVYIPPIVPSGNNSLEARLKALEVAQAYDISKQKELAEELEIAHERVSALSARLREETGRLNARMEDWRSTIALWVIGALVSAVASLLLMIVKLKLPGLL